MDNEYVAPLRWTFLTPLYDAICSISRLGAGFRNEVIAALPLKGTEKILDIGCGSGALLVALKEKYPDVTAFGIDPHLSILKRAEERFAEHRLKAFLELGKAQQLPLADGSLDVYYSTLTFHHLYGAKKREAVKEMYRVLKPGGYAVIADFRKMAIPFLAHFFLMEHYGALRENFTGVLDDLFVERGFEVQKYIKRPQSLISIRVLRKPTSLV